MATRRERVILELQDDLSPGMLRAAAATKLLDRQLHGLDGSTVRANRPIRDAARETDRMSASMAKASREVNGLAVSSRRTESSINQLTGRIRVLADAAAILGPSLVPIGAIAVPAMTGLASQAGFAAMGLGSLLVAAQGVGDALKAVNQAALEPTAANLEKAQRAMAEIGPDAQAFVTRFQELRPVLSDIRDAAARGWFPGLTESLASLETIAPRVATLFEVIGRTGGRLVADGANALSGPQWSRFLTFVQTSAPQALDELGRTIGNLVRGMAELWMAFDPINDSFSSWLLKQARAFAKWSEGLSRTDGFHEFIDYIQTNGPRVADALGAVGSAVLQIIQAVAPLGGPSLQIIETFSKVISAIADSDLGTPILAGVAALALYNRTLQATAALQTRLTGSQAIGNAVASGGMFGATKAGASATRSSLKTLRSDIAVIGTTWATAGAQSERATTRMNAAMSRTKGTLGPIAKGTALMGGLALVTSGVADKFGLATTAQFAMIGAMTPAGPMGAAVGGAIGLLFDLAKAAENTKGAFDEAIKATNSAAGLGDLGTAEAALAQAKKNRDKYLKDERGSSKVSLQQGVGLAQAYGQDVSMADMPKGDSAAAQKAQKDYEKAAAAVEKLRNETAAAALAERGFSSELLTTANAAGVSSSELLASVSAIDARTAAANGAFSAETQWRQALKAAQEQATKNSAGIDGMSQAAIENRGHLESLSAAWVNQRNKMTEAGKGPEQVAAKYKVARQAFIDTATAMGVPIARARALAKELLAIPEKKAVSVTIRDNADEVAARMRAKFGTPIYQQVIVRNPSGGVTSGKRLGAEADGGFVPKTGLPYADRHLYLLADGEGVTTNRRGETDRFRDVIEGINAGLSRQQVKGMLAEGGIAGNKPKKRGSFQYLDVPGSPLSDLVKQLDFDHLGKSIKRLTKSFEESKETLEGELSARKSVAESLASSITGKFTSNLGGNTDVWSKGGSLSDMIATLQGDIAGAKAFSANTDLLRSKGLTGSALDALLQQADPATVANIAATATAEQLADYSRYFAERVDVTAAAAATAQAAAGYTAEIVRMQAQLDQVNAHLAALNGIQTSIKNDGPKKTGHAVSNASKKGASKAAHSIKKH